MQTQLWRTQRDLYSTCSCWGLAFGVTQILGFALGVTQILGFALGVTQILGFTLALEGLFGTNILESRTQNSRVWGISQREPPTRGVLRCSEI